MLNHIHHHKQKYHNATSFQKNVLWSPQTLSDKQRLLSYLGKHSVGIAEQKHDGQDSGDTHSQSTSAVIRPHPEHDPTEHDQKYTRDVHLNNVITHASLEWKCHC